MNKEKEEFIENIKKEGNYAMVTVATGKNPTSTFISNEFDNCSTKTTIGTISGMMDVLNSLKKEFPVEFYLSKMMTEVKAMEEAGENHKAIMKKIKESYKEMEEDPKAVEQLTKAIADMEISEDFDFDNF